MNEIKTYNIETNQALSAAMFWCSAKIGIRGWITVKNMHTAYTIRVYFGEGGNEGAPNDVVRPLHSRSWQVDEGQMVYFASTLTGNRLRIQESSFKPTPDEWFDDESYVENLPFCATGVAITTTYNMTTLAKGYATFFQCTIDGGFGGGGRVTIELSSDNGVTYCPVIPLTDADATKLGFQEERILTQVRVTRIAGTFSVYYR